MTVLVPSRMRVDARWLDIVIHNVSSRGLMVGCDQAPAVGSYVEIRRGTLVIVGRVQWTKGRFFGLRSQDRLSVKALVDEPRLASRPDRSTAQPESDRRAERRLAHEAQMARKMERSRSFASMFQFLVLVVVGMTMAGIAAHTVYSMLSAPAARIEDALKVR
ncbi:PilZ domain-containing protein [Sphingomonas sp. LR60]|uniref:PilZ domain-containing protein n=1 Tax=Sphingomonas sp. LR60 TaxID=3050233 RepID=UPI002FE28AC4